MAERSVSSVPNGMVMKKRLHFAYIYRTYARTFEQEDKKRRRSLTTWNCLTWGSNVDGKRDRWSLVPWLQDVCGYTYSETKVDLKLPKEEWGPAHKLAIALCRVGLGNNRGCECFLPNQIVVLRRRRTGSVELKTSLPKLTRNFYWQWGFLITCKMKVVVGSSSCVVPCLLE